MTGIGWEFWGLKFSWFITAFVTAVLVITTVLTKRDNKRMNRIDMTAGDEGEDW
jgi:hypothetical protein